jgi:hypothetical protein
MSLKHFHLIFIGCSEGLMAFLAHWSGLQHAAGAPDWGAAWISKIGICAGLAYLAWFIRHFRALR